ncbi:Trypsin Inhibitor like cysteine rich domain [Popillia japonica]|uniref:Trypsin Inhibitor like cysteine rich domain n=1 Tax=Popillia japonica TaxID=7064 RepID=A0AAW1JYG5_POPJA
MRKISILCALLFLILFVIAKNINRCPRPNEILKCGGSCQVECADLEKECPTGILCENDCYCIDDFVRNNRGICVPPEECEEYIFI